MSAGGWGWCAALAQSGLAAVLLVLLRRRALAAARAAHEIRGPLCTARLGVEHLMQRPDPATAAAVELELRRAALALDDLQQPAWRSAREPVDVGSLLVALRPGWSALARAHGARLIVDAPAGLVVRGDRLRLAQACANLVANAVEHGGGTVTVRARSLTGRVRVEVTDEGPGLPAAVTALAGGRRALGRGRGHGLAVAHRVASRHGGRLAAGPAACGARLVLELPAAAATPARRTAL